MKRRTFITHSAGALGLAALAQSAPAQESSDQQKAMMIRLILFSVYVPDQEKALKFYTEILGFVKKQDIPVGGARWLTVVSSHEPDGTELVLEPLGLQPARVFQKTLFDMGVPFTAFLVGDIQKEYDRLTGLGVKFRMKPIKIGSQTVANFEDTCGNLIQLFQR